MIYKNDYKDYKSCKLEDDLAICKSKHTSPPKILLECGEGTGSRTFTSSDDKPFQIACVTVNTKCFNKAEVLIKFSSLVRITNITMDSATNATVRLKYELFKSCDNKEPKSLGIWSFDEVNFRTDLFGTEEESFSFIFCDINTNLDCCDYFVTITPVEIINTTAIVSNGRMAALSEDLNYDGNTNKSKPKEMILECTQGKGSVSYKESRPSQDQNMLPATIAHVSLDTTCLKQPMVLIEFSTVINLDLNVLNVILKFELFRLCDDGEPISLGVWQFIRNPFGAPQVLSKTFDFIFCESNVPSSCCEYFVTVTPVLVERGFADDQLNITNSRITALAQSNSICSTDCRIHAEENTDSKGLLLTCGSGTGSNTFTAISNPPFQLANVQIDTILLCKPRVNINFSSIVNFNNFGSAILKLRYELFRACGNRNPVSVGVWDIQALNIDLVEKSTNTFNFTFCECLACFDCCDYFVNVTPIIIEDGTITISNGQIAALTQEGK